MMRRHPHLVGAALCGAALFFAADRAFADPIDPASLVPALDVYVDAIVAGHNAAGSCADAKSPARSEDDWNKGRAIFIATLWANGFPSDFVRTTTQRLAAPAAGPKPDCTDPALAGELGTASTAGWIEALERPLGGMDLTLVHQPVAPAAWDQIKAAFAGELPQQRRMLQCIAVSAPDLLPVAVHDWDQMLVRIGQKLAAAGLPRDEVSAQLSAAEANTLWHRGAPDAEAGLRDACTKEQAWQERLYRLEYGQLSAAVEKLLPPAE